MSENQKQYDLEERTEKFAAEVGDFIDSLPSSIRNLEYSKQVIRSSGSIAANYIEANESFSKKDFIYRVKICRKEAKESRLWLRLIKCKPEQEEIRLKLIQEATELMKIFGAIITKSE
ncbi:MAG TPA: four helix bundle protein [Bacteroidetes bacterium]|nr:four helix bundle protein [Bacteroidota bacterium]